MILLNKVGAAYTSIKMMLIVVKNYINFYELNILKYIFI